MEIPTLEQSRDATVQGEASVSGLEWLRIGGVALAVRDLDRVATFYREVIGLELIAQAGGVVRLGVAGTAFLDLLHRPDALPDDPATAGLFHTAFLLPSRADLGSWLAHFGQLGQRLDGAADHLVSEAVYLRDPEGNGIEVYADRPRAQWRWRDDGEGRRVEMANRPLDAQGLLRAATPRAGAPDGTHIGHVHLRVGSIGDARRFYGDALGMDVTALWENAAFLSTGGYHHRIAANTWSSAGTGPRDPARAGLASVTLDIADAAALAGIVQRTGLAGPSLSGLDLNDPWGTMLQLRLAASCGSLTSPPNQQ